MNIREKILVVEDEKSISHFICTILCMNIQVDGLGRQCDSFISLRDLQEDDFTSFITLVPWKEWGMESTVGALLTACNEDNLSGILFCHLENKGHWTSFLGCFYIPMFHLL